MNLSTILFNAIFVIFFLTIFLILYKYFRNLFFENIVNKIGYSIIFKSLLIGALAIPLELIALYFLKEIFTIILVVVFLGYTGVEIIAITLGFIIVLVNNLFIAYIIFRYFVLIDILLKIIKMKK